MTGWRLSIAAALLGGILGCGAEPGLSANSAWVRLTPPGAATAGYLNIVNGLDEPVQLTGARAAGFGAVMIHETRIVDGQARMVHAAPLVIAPHSETAFAPGGLHLMMMQPQTELTAGATLRIELEFAQRESLIVDAVVRSTPP